MLKSTTRQCPPNNGYVDAGLAHGVDLSHYANLKPRHRGNKPATRTLRTPRQIDKMSRAVQARIPDMLRRKRVLVTGGAGFVGSHVVDFLVEAGCSEVIVVDNMISGRPENLIPSIRSGRVKLVLGDIRDAALMEDVVAGTDTVFHHAALGNTHCIADPRLALEIMASATFNLFDLCVKSGVRKIVMASSACVYGAPDTFPTNERHGHHTNRTLFGAAKSFSEALLRSFNEMYGTSYVVLRYFDIYGPRMYVHGSPAEHLVRWIERIEAGLPPIVLGDGNQTLDMLHVEDAARANLLAAVSPISDVALNVGSGEETSYLTLVRILARIMGRPNMEPVFWEDRPFNAVPRRFADIQAARRTISFEATVSLTDGLARFVDWWRDQLVARRLH